MKPTMRGRIAIAGAAAATALAMSTPAAASAASVYAGPGAASSGFLTSNVSISAGQPLSFTNLDLVGHDVTALETTKVKPPARHHHHHRPSPPPQPLFRSQTVGFGTTTPVVGVESLKPGAYAFFCSIHANMTGTLTVH